jgi:DNA-binding MurR/RpiR family transcriptional regulator
MHTKEQILGKFHLLSPKLQDAAKFVVDHPNEVVMLSMRMLAQRANARPASMFRLAQQLGYSGWPALKDAFANDLGLHSKRYGQRAKALAGRGKDAGLLNEIFAAHRHNLDLTESQSGGPLRKAATLLQQSTTVHIAGFRASFAIAYSFFYGYRLFRNSVQLIDSVAGGLEMQLRTITKHDSVLVVSFAPYSKEAMLVIQAAKKAKASIIALTDSNASPLALMANVSILFTINSPSFFPSVAAGVAATEALLGILVADDSETLAKPIDRVEQNLLDSGAYLQAPSH